MRFTPTDRRTSLRLVLAGALLLATASAAHAQPVAPVRDEPMQLHGVSVSDPYHYMEKVQDPQVQTWMRAQGDFARQTLDKIALRDALAQRIGQIAATSGDSVRDVVRLPGQRIYYLKRGKGDTQYKLVWRQGLSGQEQVLVDPQQEMQRTGTPHAINYFVPSWDGQHVAYGVSAGGSEDASLYILNVRSGKLVGAPIPRVHDALVHWLPDSRSLTFNQLKPLQANDPDTETFLDSRVLWLRLGQSEAQAQPIFGPTVSQGLGLERLEVGSVSFTPGSPWMLARTTDTTLPQGSLLIARVADIGKPSVPWRRIASANDLIVEVALQGDQLYYRTHKDAPRFKIMRLDLRQPQLAQAHLVAVPPADAVLEDFELTRRAVVATVRQGASVGLRRYAAADVNGQPLSPQGFAAGTAASVHGDPAHAYDDVLFAQTSWTQWPQEWHWRAGAPRPSGLLRQTQAAPTQDIEVHDVMVRSHDGVLVPMTVLHKKGLALDGNNPTWLSAYGAYGISQTANFTPGNLAWLERGGVLAVANVRGGGAFGEAWHQAGFKQTKPNTWKDGIACAHYLIDQKYASPRTLGISGGSAGGIFVGRAVTTAPELFAAAVFNVGALDTVRAEESANGITNISEFGTYRKPDEFAALLEMSTYHQIKDGTPYPAVLLVHGMNDPRVDVWNSAKTTARLQAASSSGKPVLLRLDLQAGHGIGSTRTQRDSMAADTEAFLLWQMGKSGLKP